MFTSKLLPKLFLQASSRNVLQKNHLEIKQVVSSTQKISREFLQNFSRTVFTKTNKIEFKSQLPQFDLSSVIGIDRMGFHLINLIDYLQDPDKYEKKNIKFSRGIMLSGPPGTGKTMLAEAIAGQAGLRLLQVSGSALIGEFVGQGEAMLRELFKSANEDSRCLIVIDEIDSLGVKRLDSLKCSGDVHVNTLTNQLLTLMEKLKNGIVVIGTTNNYQILDPALVRPGRFDRHFVFSLPDLKARIRLLEHYTKKQKLENNISINDLAFFSTGFSPAKIALWVEEAVLLAARLKSETITQEHFNDTREVVQYGLLQNAESTSEDIRRIAIHEAGHALVGHRLGKTIYKISTFAYGNRLGVTEFLQKDSITMSKQQAMDLITQNLAGRAAETIYQIECLLSKDDLDMAKEIVSRLVREEGYGSSLSGLSSYQDIENILQKQMEYALNILKNDRETLDCLIQALIECRELNSHEFQKVINGEKISKPPKTILNDLSLLPKSRLHLLNSGVKTGDVSQEGKINTSVIKHVSLFPVKEKAKQNPTELVDKKKFGKFFNLTEEMINQIEIYYENETVKVGYQGIIGYNNKYPEYIIDGPLEIIRKKLIENTFTDLYKIISSDDDQLYGMPILILNLKKDELSKLLDLINSVDMSYSNIRKP